MRYLYLLPLGLLLLVPLAGCSYTMYLSDADEHGGTVNFVTEMSQDAALEKAKDHCRQYNLGMRVITTDLPSGTMRFSCQAP